MGLLIEKEHVHVDVNYSPLILDEEFVPRAKRFDEAFILVLKI